MAGSDTGKGLRELADGEALFPLLLEPRQQGAPRRVGEGGEGPVEAGRLDS